MKILGRSNTSTYDVKYIVEISADEINGIFNNSYESKESLKIKQLETGDNIDIANGYNFKKDIQNVCDKMISSHEQFLKSSNTLYELSKLLTNHGDESTTIKKVKS